MKIGTILLCAFCTIATAVFAQEKYTIKGTAGKDMNGVQLGLFQLDDGQQVAETLLDSAVVKKGKFKFSGVVESPRIAIIKRLNEEGELCPLILEKGNITADMATNRCGGTSLNDTLSVACRKMKTIMTEKERLSKESIKALEGLNFEDKSDKMKIDSIIKTKIINNVHKESLLRDTLLQYINSHKNSLVGVYLFARLDGASFYYKINEMKEGATAVFLDHPLVKKSIELQLLNVQRMDEAIKLREKRKQMEPKIKIGDYFSDAKVKDKSGNEVTLSDYVGKGKYVLIDFWASWCGPCRREMPNVKAAYEKYASKGFEVISISTDTKQQKWEEAIQELGMTWTQLLDVDAANTYDIFAIPSTFLIDPKGYVIEKNLRGKKLEEVLSKLIK